MQYPDLSRELIQMANDDQAELRAMQERLDALPTEQKRQQLRQEIAEHCRERATRMLAILDRIGAPTIAKLGPDAAEVVSLFALHSYLDEMKYLLALYETQFVQDPDSIYKQAIPPLADRIMIAEQRRQKFGTNWSIDKDGTWFLISVEDFSHVNTLRATYGLESLSKPRCLSIGAEEWPLGHGPAVATDQKELTDDEYAEYTRYMFRAT